MPKVFIDAIGTHQVGGGRTAIHTLLENMLTLDRETKYVVLGSEHEPSWDRFDNVEQRVVAGGRFAVRLALQRQLPRWARDERAGLVHFTKNLGCLRLPCPYVVTIHDLTTLLLPEQHSFADVAYWRWVEPWTIRKAARVVSVSHTTAADIERFYQVPRTSIEVIGWAAHERFAPVRDAAQLEQLRLRHHLPERFVLFLGILAKKKNLPTLLRALAYLRSTRPDAPDLVIVGRGYPQSGDAESVPLVGELGLGENVHFVGAVPDDELPLFYSAADAYVLPSLHEGFGIPCLEAMACGTPVVTTHGGALPEVAGDAAILVEQPMDHAELSAALERVIFDQGFRQDLIARGFRRASEFSWADSARRMLGVYDSVLEERAH